MRKTNPESRRSKNKYQRDYYRNNPMYNAWQCHNSSRVANGLDKISLEEFKLWHKKAPKDIRGRVNAGWAREYLKRGGRG